MTGRNRTAAAALAVVSVSLSLTLILTLILVMALPAVAITAPPATSGIQVAQVSTEDSGIDPDAPTATDQVVIADGHVDLSPRFLEDGWTIQLRDDRADPEVWRNLPDVVLHAVDAAQVQIPDQPDFAFLGSVGDSVWILPQVQQPGILWPGWNTQHPDVVATVLREVTWTLHAVEGPGAFTLFLNEGFGTPRMLFDGTAPLPQETGIEIGTHVHGNWTFAAPGIYLLDIEMTAQTSDGQTVSDRDTLRLAIGDATDPTQGFTAASLSPQATQPATPAPSPAMTDPGTTTTASAPASDVRSDPTGLAGLPLMGLSALLGVLAVSAVTILVRRRRDGGSGGAPSIPPSIGGAPSASLPPGVPPPPGAPAPPTPPSGGPGAIR